MTLLLLVACAGSSDDTGVPAANLVDTLTAPGPHAVGYRASSVTYDEPLTGARTLRLAVWFPTDATSGGSASYLNGAIEAPDVLDDPAPTAGVHPVVLFSHGHQGFAENSSFLMEHLASHGYVVAAPDHTDNTTFDGGDRATSIYFQRPRDLSAVLDALPGELAVDTTEVTAIGHSFGGYTVFALAGATYDPATIAACTPDASSFCSTMDDAAAAAFAQGFRDERVVAAVPMAGGDFDLFGAAGVGALPVPVLQMTGEMDPGDGAAYWEALHAADDAHQRVDIVGAGHQAFTDFSGVLADGGTIDAERGFLVLRAYTLAAVRAARGDDAAQRVIDGEVEVASEAVLFR
jgi:predicted dienelactone hydrolase